MHPTMHRTRSILHLALTAGLLGAAATVWSADAPPQVVTVEVRLVQAPRAAVNALLSPTAYALDDQQQRQIQDWVNQKKATILAQPRISTVSGQCAQLRAVRELIYPTEYGPPESAEGPLSPPIPGAFKTRELGVLLNITPAMGVDPQWVHITLIPERSRLSARPFVKHEASTRGGGRAMVSQPDIHSLNLTTQVTLKSGTTVVLGVYDPWADSPREAQETVILALLSATVHALE